MVVDVGGALWAVVAVDSLSTLTVVSVLGRLAAVCDLELRLGDDLVHGVGYGTVRC